MQTAKKWFNMNNLIKTGSLFVLIFTLLSSFVFGQQLHRTQVKSVKELKKLLTYSGDRNPMISAQRGGPYLGYPENCIATFENILQYTPAIIECDVRMTKDSVLMMMHDETLSRTTTGKGKVSELAWEDIKHLNLIDVEGLATQYQIPTFDEVLRWAVGKAILTVDVKRDVLFKKVVKSIEEAGAEAYAIVITYHVEDARKVHQLNPDLMISITIRNEDELKWVESSGIPLENIVAFVGISEPPVAFYDLLHSKGLFCILGTMGNLDNKAIARGDQVYMNLVKNGADALSTDRPFEVAEALKKE